jgi:hypothetical protein
VNTHHEFSDHIVELGEHEFTDQTAAKTTHEVPVFMYPFRSQEEFLQSMLPMPEEWWAAADYGSSRWRYEKVCQDHNLWAEHRSHHGDKQQLEDLERDTMRRILAGKPLDKAKRFYEELLNDPDLRLDAVVNRRRVPNARRFIRPCEEGDSVNIERAQERESDCWECHTFKSTRQRSVSIGINYSTGHHDSELFPKLAASAAVVAGVLRSKGHRVRVVGTRIVKNTYGFNADTRVIGSCWPIIDFGERLDYERILAWGHPGVFNWWARLWTWWLYNSEELVQQRGGYAMLIETRMPPQALREAGVDHILYTPSSYGVHVADVVKDAVQQVGGTF